MTRLDQEFAKSVKDGVNALVLEVERLESVGESLEVLVKEAYDTLNYIVQKAPGYDWNMDSLFLTRRQGDFNAKAEKVIAQMRAQPGSEEK